MKSSNFFKSHPILFRMSVVIILPFAFIAVFVWTYLHSSLPQSEGRIISSYVTNDVEVIRDANGVPHIYAKKDNDAFFALGYVHAQDRLWQLEIQRRTAGGRMSEILGNETLQQDQFMRTLGMYYSAKSSYKLLSDESKASLISYVEGVNTWLQEKNPLPAEYELLGIEPEPWTLIDSLVTLNLLSLNLSGNWREEINRLMLAQELSEEKMAEIFPAYPDDAPSTIKPLLKKDKDALVTLQSVLSDMEDRLIIGAKGVGSNAWVVSGSLTESGKPILANDPHLAAQIPSSFYLAELQGDKIHVTGASLPGLPIIIIGHNEQISWGATNMMADSQDLYKERLSRENPDIYEFNGEMVAMQVREESIYVKPEFPEFLRDPIVPIKWKVRSTKRGPVISDVTDHLSQPMSLQWTALSFDNKSYESILQMNYAQDWTSFKGAFKNYVSPALNFVYADKKGNIGFFAAGKIPLRSIGDGSVPVPGWSDEYSWKGFVPFEEQASIYNPEAGFIVTANNRVVGKEYPYHITVDWLPSYRAERIESLLKELSASGKKLSVEDMQTIQMDQLSLMAKKLVPELVKVTPSSEVQKEVIELLNNWDFVMTKESIPSLIFHSWLRHIQYIMLRDDFRGDMLNISRSTYLFDTIENVSPLFLENVLSRENSVWCDQVYTPEKENCETILLMALEKAIIEMEKISGFKMSGWEWGSTHKIIYPHTPFHRFKILDILFDREAYNGGGKHTVNIGPSFYSIENGYEQMMVPAFRTIIDLNKLDYMQFTLSTGQSGNVYSKHYDDLLEFHHTQQYKAMSFSKDKVSGKMLIISPQQEMTK
jgi:penicillin amidase